MPPSNHAPGRLPGWIICLLGALLFAAGCARPDERVFTVRGIVRAPYADGAITIQHEAIPEFMPAMTMPFYASPSDVRDLAPGDRVEFEFRVRPDRSRATKFRKIGAEATATAAAVPPGAARTAVTRRLRPGDVVPPFSLINQDNQPLTAEHLQGRHTVLSFLFTRCPVPEFCPLLAKKLRALQDLISAAPGGDVPAQIITISIDPEYDRPDVLRGYGKSVGADFSRWRLATGAPADVDQLARLFAVRIERNGTSLDHTLATALIGPDGRMVEIWRGNAWKPQEIFARMTAGAPTGR